MTLDELKDIEQQANKARLEQSDAKGARSMLAGVRNRKNQGPTWQLLKEMEGYGWRSETARCAFLTVLDEFQADLLLIAEMRLEAKARAHGQHERTLRAQLAAYLTEPEKTENLL